MASRKPNSASKPSSGREFYKYSGLGFEFVVIVGIFAFIGEWADRKWGWAPWGLLVGLGVGLTTGLYFLVKESNKMLRSMGEEKDPESTDSEKRNEP